MARHKQFAIATDMAVYFCDPHSPGSAAPTRTPTACCASTSPRAPTCRVHGPEDLDHVAQELNGRPRKTLGWETPAERLRDLLTT